MRIEKILWRQVDPPWAGVPDATLILTTAEFDAHSLPAETVFNRTHTIYYPKRILSHVYKM